VEVNDYLRKLLAFSDEEMRATTFIDITHPEDRERTAALVQTVRSGRADAYEMEKRYLRKDGSTVWCRLRATALRTQEGAIDYWIGIIEDITERKRLDKEKADLQSQLLHAQKMESVGRLAGGIAHDFNNMLHVITGFADLLVRKLPGDSQLSSYVNEIQRAAGRAQDVTRQLLAFSRRQMISPVPSDLNSLVARMSGGLSRLIGEDVELRVEGAEGLWGVSVDPTQIDQILLNLAVNARDAMPDGGKMTIETTNVRLDETYCRRHATAKPGDYVLLAVSDNGIGMNKETLSRIFEPFFTTKEKGKGTGLGLATVHGIVEQNGGFVNVYSEPGQGTTFRIYLPRTLDEGAAAAEAAERPGDMGGGTVLVVEDEESVRRLTAAVVESLGYTVLVAASGGEAIKLFERDEPRIDVVLTDVVMPGMSGRELRDRLERLRPGIRVLFTSGYTGNVIAHHGMLDRGVHFIAKPFGAADLARALRGVLARPSGG
jgi:PAS domain S-box-containing protein